MNKQPKLSPKELREREFEARKREVESRVEAPIGRIDASAPQQSMEAAETVIAEGGKCVETLTAEHLSSNLQAAIDDAATSVTAINDLSKEETQAKADLGRIPACGALEMGIAVLWLIAAAAAFFTELKLTDSLVMLLGYRRDDPTGRAIGAAFASAMLVFEVIVSRLALVTPPASLFSSADTGAQMTVSQVRTSPRWLRVTGAIGLGLTLVGVGWLQVVSVIKIAPTRSIYASVQRGQRALTAREDQILEESTLFFSVCVLISGGFMAAAGTRELSLWLRRKTLERRISDTEARRMRIVAHLDATEFPALAAALESAGLPSVWTRGEPLEQAMARLGTSLAATPTGIRAAAETERRLFEATKRIILNETRMKPSAAARSPISWRETVDDVLRRAI